MTEPLASDEDLSEFQDGEAALILEAADAIVRGYCGWHIYPSVTETVVVDGRCSTTQPLPTLLLTDVSAVENDGEEMDLDHVYWSRAGYLVSDRKMFTWKPRGVVAEITHGYDEIPSDLKAVVLGVASRLSEAPGSNLIDHKMGPFEEKFVINDDGSIGGITFTKHERDILNRYRIPGIA